MRIVAGSARSRIITPPAGFNARPTTDFAKENLFNVLSNYFDFDDVEVLDLFAGTGSISYEFCSRGVARAVAVELVENHRRFIADTAAKLGFDQLVTIRGDATTYVSRCSDSFDIVFADPPYEMEGVDDLPALVLGSSILKPEGWFILEHSDRKDFSSLPHFDQCRRYGSVNFSIFIK